MKSLNTVALLLSGSLISTSVLAGVPDTTEATPGTVETQPTVAQSASPAVSRLLVQETPMAGFYIGGEFDYTKMESEVTVNSIDTTSEYNSGPVSFLFGYTGRLGDIYLRYTMTDIEAEDYSGIKEYGGGIRFHNQLKVGKTGFNTRVEVLFGDTDAEAKYKGALLGVGATTRAGKNVVINYGIDYRSINWDLPSITGYYSSRNDDGFGIYVNMHYLFTK